MAIVAASHIFVHLAHFRVSIGGEDGAVMNKELSSSWGDIDSREALCPAEFCAMSGKRFEAGVSTEASTALITGKKVPNSNIWADSYI